MHVNRELTRIEEWRSLTAEQIKNQVSQRKEWLGSRQNRSLLKQEVKDLYGCATETEDSKS